MNERSRGDRWHEHFNELARGGTGALEALYAEASRSLFGLALWRTGSAEDAGDVVQEVFVRLVEMRERLSGVRNPRSWLLTVTRRIAVDLTRKRKRTRTESLDEFPYLVAEEINGERQVDASRLSGFLPMLPANQREAIYLRDFAGCTFAEAARVMRVPKFTAASRYRLGIARLKSLMEGER